MPKTIKASFELVGLCLSIIALVYFLYAVADQYHKLQPAQWNIGSYVGLLAAVSLYLGIIVISGYAWLLLLRACGGSANAFDAVTVFALSQFAKYIPGNVAHHVGRIVLASKRDIKVPRVALSIALEAGGIVVAAFAVSLPYLLFADRRVLHILQELSRPMLSAAIVCVIIVIFIVFIICVRSAVRQRYFKLYLYVKRVAVPFFACLLMYVLCFFMMGLAADIVVQNLIGAKESHIVLLTAAFALAWAAGFITIGAPAGLGVREVVLLKMLSPTYGISFAVITAAVLRLVSMIADGAAFVGAFVIRKKLRR